MKSCAYFPRTSKNVPHATTSGFKGVKAKLCRAVEAFHINHYYKQYKKNMLHTYETVSRLPTCVRRRTSPIVVHASRVNRSILLFHRLLSYSFCFFATKVLSEGHDGASIFAEALLQDASLDLHPERMCILSGLD
jgi:hypothetical protein